MAARQMATKGDEMTDEVGYGIIIGFLDGSESFCYGYECGLVDADMMHGEVMAKRTVHAGNKQQIEVIANKNNYSVEWEQSSIDEWVYLNAKPNGGAEEKRKSFTVVEGGLA